MRFSLSMKDAVRRVATSSMSHRSEKSAKWAGSREDSREYSSLSKCNCSVWAYALLIYAGVARGLASRLRLKLPVAPPASDDPKCRKGAGFSSEIETFNCD